MDRDVEVVLMKRERDEMSGDDEGRRLSPRFGYLFILFYSEKVIAFWNSKCSTSEVPDRREDLTHLKEMGDGTSSLDSLSRFGRPTRSRTCRSTRPSGLDRLIPEQFLGLRVNFQGKEDLRREMSLGSSDTKNVSCPRSRGHQEGRKKRDLEWKKISKRRKVRGKEENYVTHAT